MEENSHFCQKTRDRKDLLVSQVKADNRLNPGNLTTSDWLGHISRATQASLLHPDSGDLKEATLVNTQVVCLLFHT